MCLANTFGRAVNHLNYEYDNEVGQLALSGTISARSALAGASSDELVAKRRRYLRGEMLRSRTNAALICSSPP